MSDTELMMRLSKELQKHPQTKAMIGREALLLRCVAAAQAAQSDRQHYPPIDWDKVDAAEKERP